MLSFRVAAGLKRSTLKPLGIISVLALGSQRTIKLSRYLPGQTIVSITRAVARHAGEISPSSVFFHAVHVAAAVARKTEIA